MLIADLESRLDGQLGLAVLLKQQLVYLSLLLLRQLLALMMSLEVGAALLQSTDVLLAQLHVALPPGVHLFHLPFPPACMR